ncbi:hypothetical protein L227DRAFT_577339 [Lentinus tigrinus ALCF2SS1-6]|uniref:Uncharacterized protein n=1 Tax=Lentinus tigrinus ALCF2SS1-6 TaxID=1328759 RepID=A0A5C2S462_9APHY|nr:hypothetical protein L227DRAFT_577339 [Lentinus tigrinus ALCF2SS1-6]
MMLRCCIIVTHCQQRDNAQVHDHDALEEVPFLDGTFPWDKDVPGPQNTYICYPVEHIRNN